MTTTNRSRGLLHEAVSPLSLESATAAELEVYARDPFAHLEADEEWHDENLGEERVGHIFIPDITDELADNPLVPMEHQVDLLEHWLDLERLSADGLIRFNNALVEKSRQMGMTWWLAYVVWWLLTYHDVAGGYSNMNSSEVDDGGAASTPDSFFGKVRHIHERVPPRFRAPLQFRGGNAPLIRYRGGSGFIVGRGAVVNPGRGGTYRYWIVDEAARFPHGEAAHAALARAVPSGRLYNSTPYGEGNVYFRLIDTKPEGYIFTRYHWTEHPLYGKDKHVAAVAPDWDTGEDGYIVEQETDEMNDTADNCALCEATVAGVAWSAETPTSHRYPGKMTSTWYERAVLDLTDDQVAAELDIDYAGSLPARVYTEFDEHVHVVDEIPYTPRMGVELALDYGLDCTAIAILQDHPNEIRQIGELEISDANVDDVSRALIARCLAIGVPEKELREEFRRSWLAVGDPSGDDREVGTARSIAYEYGRNGWHITAPEREPVVKTIISTKRILRGRPKRYRVSAATCPETIRHWKLNRWPQDRFGNRKAGATRPEDDEHNHMMRALAYYCTYKYPAPNLEDALSDAVSLARLRMRDGVETPAHYGFKF